MKRLVGTVVANSPVTGSTRAVRIWLPEIAREASAGQFLLVRCARGWDPLLRRPMSLYRILREEAELLVRPVGRGSSYIASLRPGEEIDCLGPLGRGFRLDDTSRRLLMVGGGYGVAPLVALAERAIREERSVVLLFGADTARQVFPADLLPAEVEYHVTTEDGSSGIKGMVTDLAGPFLSWADAIYACGPHAMLSSLASVCRRAGWPAPVQVSLEAQMACGVGACLGCSVSTVRGPRMVCSDGPVFNLSHVVWE